MTRGSRHELGIGRPDLDGPFDDGGLVDVNHSPAEVLCELPGIDRGIADRIVSTRSELGGFTSLDEMSVTLDLPPAKLDAISDRLLFLRDESRLNAAESSLNPVSRSGGWSTRFEQCLRLGQVQHLPRRSAS